MYDCLNHQNDLMFWLNLNFLNMFEIFEQHTMIWINSNKWLDWTYSTNSMHVLRPSVAAYFDFGMKLRPTDRPWTPACHALFFLLYKTVFWATQSPNIGAFGPLRLQSLRAMTIFDMQVRNCRHFWTPKVISYAKWARAAPNTRAFEPYRPTVDARLSRLLFFTVKKRCFGPPTGPIFGFSGHCVYKACVQWQCLTCKCVTVVMFEHRKSTITQNGPMLAQIFGFSGHSVHKACVKCKKWHTNV